MSFYDAIRVGASGAGDYEIERSLRFNSADSTHLQNTTGRTVSTGAYTLSLWVKIGTLSTSIFTVAGGLKSSGDSNSFGTMFYYNNKFYWYHYSNADNDAAQTDGVIRDPSAWYHVLISKPVGSNGTLYLNGVAQTKQTSSSSEIDMFSGNFLVGAQYLTSTGYRRYFDGYIAELHAIDGTALTPSSFTETNVKTGQLIPKKYSGSHGSKGFYLNFSDNSGTTATTLGKDYSGNGVNFTPFNFSVAAGAGNDSVEDTPTNNFPTFNPLCENNNHTYSEGNLKVTHAANNQSGSTTSMATATTGKWYWEVRALDSFLFIGVTADTYLGTGNVIAASNTGGSTVAYYNDGQKYVGGSPSSYGASFANGDLIGVAVDMDNGQVTFYKNNASQGAISLVSTRGHIGVGAVGTGQALSMSINFGQQAFTYTPPTGFKKLCSANLPDPTILLSNKHFDTLLYSGTGSANSVTGLNFAPDWVWAKVRSHSGDHLLVDQVRGGSKSLNSNNTDTESSLANRDATFLSNGIRWNGNSLTCNESGKTYVAWNWDAGETDSATYTVKVVSDYGNKYRFNDFGTSAVTLDLAEGGTYTFDGSDSSMSGHPFVIGTAANGSVYSTGVTYQLDGASVSYSAYTSGYATATTRKLIITVPASAPQLYYWCSIHSGMGGAINTNSTLGSSNFDGTLQATVKTSPTAGFSIVTYTGNGSDGATIGHGLGVKPDFITIKKRANNSGGNTGNWISQHKSLTNGVNATSTLFTLTSYSSSALYLNLNNGQSSYGFDNQVNGNTDTFVAYCFSEVAGYSKFGSYKGNGSTDGTFVYTNFRPAVIILKRTNSAAAWVIHDDKRAGYNGDNDYLHPDNSQAESDGSTGTLDILSNGFKLRMTAGTHNGSGDTFIYLAFAESPFKNSRAR